jgi:hypothetical protein
LALETTGGLQINLFPALTGQDYLLNRQTAERQLQHMQETGAVPQENLLTALDQSSLSQGTGTIFSGLFEGVASGEGVLRLVLRASDWSVVASDEVHLKLLDVRDMYKPAQMILYASGALSRSDFHP